MKRIITLTTGFLLIGYLNGYAQSKKFQLFSDGFIAGYKALPIPSLDIAYIDVLKRVPSRDTIKKEVAFFKAVRKDASTFDRRGLSDLEKQDLDQISFELSLNLERLMLEEEWSGRQVTGLPIDHIAIVPNGKAWYRYLLKRWLGKNVTPSEIFQFGLAEVADANRHIDSIRHFTGLSLSNFQELLDGPHFQITDTAEVRRRFLRAYAIIGNRLPILFSDHHIPELKIARSTRVSAVQTPGYYDDGTFYYNIYDRPYNSRSIGWLFLHEALPGHHYQISISAQMPHTAVQRLFSYVGAQEGWGAYVERYGKILGLYPTPYDEFGHWEWDLVRAVRIPLDIGVNYLGWNDQQALSFWKNHVKGQDEIAMREIKRVRNWPVQAITYNFGAGQIASWKAIAQQRSGRHFNIKEFHELVLKNLDLPFDIAGKKIIAHYHRNKSA